MNDFWSGHLVSLEKSNPELVRVLSSRGPSFTDQYQLMSSPNGRLLLESGHMISPDLSAQDLRGSLVRMPCPQIVIICGFGVGEGLRILLNSDVSKFVKHILIIEPNYDALSWALQSVALQDILADPRLKFFVSENYEVLFSEFFHWLRIPERAFRMTADVVLYESKIPERRKEFYRRALDEWEASKKQIQRQYGEKEDSLLGLRYVSENLSLIASSPGINCLRQKFRDFPAVIASTGPSLVRSLPHLRQIQDRCLIISADASLNILLENGVTPHLVATLERDLWAKRFFERSSRQVDRLKSFLVAYPFIPKEGLSSYRGSILFAYRDYGYFQFFNQIVERGIVPSSSSVAHFCFNIARYLECSEIVLIGQDLAYDPRTFASHAEGIAYEDWSKQSSLEKMKDRVKKEGLGDVLFVPGNKDAEVPTHSTYFSFMKEFSWEASQCAVPVVNSTDGGARIPLIPWKPFEEVTSAWRKVPDLFEIMVNSAQVSEGNFAPFLSVLEFLDDLQSKLRDILQLTEHSDIFDKLSAEKRSEIIRSLRLAQTELMKDARFVSFVIQNAGIEFLKCENSWANREARNDFDFSSAMSDLRAWSILTCEVAGRVRVILASGLQTPTR